MITPAAPPALFAAAADTIARARLLATELGPDSSRAWDLLGLAADVERAAMNLAAELGAATVLA